MRSFQIGLRRPVVVRTLLVMGGLLAVVGIAAACKTPVYRFAMYNWDRTPYVIYYLHQGQIPAGDEKVNEGIRKLAKASPAANVELVTIDTSVATPLEGVPAPLRDEAAYVLEQHKDAKAGMYVVYSPLSNEIYAGAMKAEDVALLAESPARKKMTAMLAGGKAAVMLLVLGKDAEANAKAEKECQKVIKAASEGLITGDDGAIPGLVDLDPSGAGPDAEEEESNKIEVGLVTLSRDDPKERWLLRSLMHVEEELLGRTEAMVFTIYGRGRANLPNIGSGIEEKLLADQIRFVMGPCSCQVKRGNPGMDLITSVDWKLAAQAMAEKYGTETGNEHLLGEAEFPNIFSEIVDPPADEPDSDGNDVVALNDDKPEDHPEDATDPVATAAGEADADEGVAGEPAGDDAQAPLADSPNDKNAAARLAASAASEPVSTDSEITSDEGSGLQNLGYGVAGAVVLMALATLLLMRPRG